jgi:hypothetical protein
MAIQLNGVAVPASMASRGIYKFNAPAIIGYNGQGDLVTAGYATVDWTFSTLTATEFAYWETTLLAGAASKRLTNNRLWNRLMAETAYSELVLERPEFENYNGNRYRNVAIRMTQVIP